MKIKALLVAAVLAGEFGLCFASTDGDLIQGVIPYPDSVSVTSVVIEPFHPEIERHTEGFNSGFKPLCLKSELLGVAYTQIRNPDSTLSLLGRS